MDKSIAWPSLSELPENTITPRDYEYEQLRRTDVATLIALIGEWHPDIKVGTGKAFIDSEFYDRRVSYLGESQKDVIVYVGKHEGIIVCALCLELNPEARVLHSRLGVCAPAHRGTGATLFARYVVDALAAKMGLVMAYSYVTTKSKAMQQFTERAGFHPVGILQFSDIELNSDGKPMHVTEAIYAKYYGALDDLSPLSPDTMTPALQRVWEVVSSDAT